MCHVAFEATARKQETQDRDEPWTRKVIYFCPKCWTDERQNTAEYQHQLRFWEQYNLDKKKQKPYQKGDSISTCDRCKFEDTKIYDMMPSKDLCSSLNITSLPYSLCEDCISDIQDQVNRVLKKLDSHQELMNKVERLEEV